MSFPRCLQVKQFVAVVRGARRNRFAVYATGDDKFYLFAQVCPAGYFTGLSFPVRKSELRDDVRRALANGWGNAGMGSAPE